MMRLSPTPATLATLLVSCCMLARIALAATSASPSPSPSTSPVFMFSDVSTNARLSPVLRFNLSAPEVAVLPRDDSGRVLSQPVMGFRLARVAQVNASGAATLPSSCVAGSWMRLSSNSLNASQAFFYSCTLAFPNGTTTPRANNASSSPAKLQLHLYLFNQSANVTLDRLLFSVSPVYSKLTVTVANWPWAALNRTDDRLEVRLRIGPPFNSTQLDAEENGGLLQTFRLTGQPDSPLLAQLLNGRQLVRRVRLLRAVSLDDVLAVVNLTALALDPLLRGPVDYTFDTTRSDVVISFAQFNSSVVYDPDFGVLLEGSQRVDGSSGGDDNTALIVCVSVLVPVAVLVVAAVVVSGLVLSYRHRVRATMQHVAPAEGVEFESGYL